MFMILNQRYVKVVDGCMAVLVDICGNDAIVKLEQGEMQKVSLENFKSLFTLNPSF